MFIRWAYIFPVLFLVRNRAIRYTAQTYWFFVIIDTGSVTDEGLIQHELCHVKQCYRLPVIHVILYNFCKRYRYYAELQAFKISIKYGMEKYIAANKLSNDYNLNVGFHKCYNDLV